jgi:hypothetical protein
MNLWVWGCPRCGPGIQVMAGLKTEILFVGFFPIERHWPLLLFCNKKMYNLNFSSIHLFCFLLFLIFGRSSGSQLNEPAQYELHNPTDTTHRRFGSITLTKRCRFENKARRLLQSVGGRLDVNSFESRWKETYPEDDLFRNQTEHLHLR